MEAPPPKGENCKICEFFVDFLLLQPVGLSQPVTKLDAAVSKNVTYLHCGGYENTVCVCVHLHLNMWETEMGRRRGGGEAEERRYSWVRRSGPSSHFHC